MAWFRRSKENIQMESKKKDMPNGMWIKCENCNDIMHKMQLQANAFTCSKCNYHFKISSNEYIKIIVDTNTFEELDGEMHSNDPLGFVDTKGYKDRLVSSERKTGLSEAVRTGIGKINNIDVAIGSMDFEFIGGSMGSVVGEKVARAIDTAIEKKLPFIMISRSGGARMMEAALSLMQMAKTSAKLALLAELKVPYISILTDPTTGGVTASFAMLGDFNIAEPNALIGFAGPRVIKQTIGRDLPEGFQRSEFVLEHGFLDMIVHRKEMKITVTKILSLLNS
jgi:acetyl-CoA carboxylase carboxyl transferase subunit beta